MCFKKKSAYLSSPSIYTHTARRSLKSLYIHTPHDAPPTFQRHPVTLRRLRIQQSACQPTPAIIHHNVQRFDQILSQHPLQGHHTEAMDTEGQPTKNIIPAAVGSEQIRPQSVATTPRQTRAMTGRELPGTSAANNTLASTNKKCIHQVPDEHDTSQSRQIQGNSTKTGRLENLHQCSRGQPDVANLQHSP